MPTEPLSDIYSQPPEAVAPSEPDAPTQSFATFDALIAALPREKIGIKSDIDRYFSVVTYRAGHIRIAKPKASAPPSMIGRAVDAFTDLTGELWVIDVVDDKGSETLKEKRIREEKEQAAKDRAHPAFHHPLLKSAKLIEIRNVAPTSAITDIMTDEG